MRLIRATASRRRSRLPRAGRAAAVGPVEVPQAAGPVRRRSATRSPTPQPGVIHRGPQAGQHPARPLRRDARRGLGPSRAGSAATNPIQERRSGRRSGAAAASRASGAVATRPWRSRAPKLMSPEQPRRTQRTGRGGVYSLGATLYHLLTGRPPFEGQERRRPAVEWSGASPAPRQVDPAVPCAWKRSASRRWPRGRGPLRLGQAVQGRRALARRQAGRRPPRALAVPPRAMGSAAQAGGRLGGGAPGGGGRRQRRARRPDRPRAAGTERSRPGHRRAELLERELYVSRLNLAYRECLANNVVLAERLLDECPPARRGWEWGYTRRLCHSESMTLHPGRDPAPPPRTTTPGPIPYPPWRSPPTARIAATDGSLSVHAGTRPPAGELPGLHSDGPIYSFAFSPDGKLAAVGGPPRGRALGGWVKEAGPDVPGLNDIVTGMRSPDGKRLAACTNRIGPALPETKLSGYRLRPGGRHLKWTRNPWTTRPGGICKGLPHLNRPNTTFSKSRLPLRAPHRLSGLDRHQCSSVTAPGENCTGVYRDFQGC